MDKKKLIWIGVYAVAAYFAYGYWKKKQDEKKQAAAPPATSAKGQPVPTATPEQIKTNQGIIGSMSPEERQEFNTQLISQFANYGKPFVDGMVLKTKFGDYAKKDGILYKK